LINESNISYDILERVEVCGLGEYLSYLLLWISIQSTLLYPFLLILFLWSNNKELIGEKK